MDAATIRDPAVRSVLVHGPLGCGKTTACEAAFAEAGAEVVRVPATGVKRAWLELLVSGRRITDVMRPPDDDDRLRPTVLFLDDLWTGTLEVPDVLAVIAATRAPFKVVMTCSSKHVVRFGEVSGACDLVVEVGGEHPGCDPYADSRVVDVVAALLARRPRLRELMRVVGEEPRMITHTMLESSSPATAVEQARLMRAFLDTAELEGHCFQNPDTPVAEVPYALRCHAALSLAADETGKLKHSQAHNRIAQHVLLRVRAAQLYSSSLLGFPNILAWAGRLDERMPTGASCYAAALARQLRALLQKKL